MNELDHVWSQMLADAGAKASEMGRHDVAEYLRLKATNDAIRARGVGWLIDSFIEIAADEQRSNPVITIERVDGHSFALGHSTMRGTLLEMRHGVRCLSVEAGWARGPRDGIMQKGALAHGRISHFGMPKAVVELRLTHTASLPEWLDDSDSAVAPGYLREHLGILLAA